MLQNLDLQPLLAVPLRSQLFCFLLYPSGMGIEKKSSRVYKRVFLEITCRDKLKRSRCPGKSIKSLKTWLALISAEVPYMTIAHAKLRSWWLIKVVSGSTYNKVHTIPCLTNSHPQWTARRRAKQMVENHAVSSPAACCFNTKHKVGKPALASFHSSWGNSLLLRIPKQKAISIILQFGQTCMPATWHRSQEVTRSLQIVSVGLVWYVHVQYMYHTIHSTSFKIRSVTGLRLIIW